MSFVPEKGKLCLYSQTDVIVKVHGTNTCAFTDGQGASCSAWFILRGFFSFFFFCILSESGVMKINEEQ